MQALHGKRVYIAVVPCCLLTVALRMVCVQLWRKDREHRLRFACMHRCVSQQAWKREASAAGTFQSLTSCINHSSSSNHRTSYSSSTSSSSSSSFQQPGDRHTVQSCPSQLAAVTAAGPHLSHQPALTSFQQQAVQPTWAVQEVQAVQLVLPSN
jgi:hypothetical protein